MRAPEGASRDTRCLGDALIDAQKGTGVLATVYIDRVLDLARHLDINHPTLLGRTIAHEIGHLLLATNTHSTSGLMRELWSPEELLASRADDWVLRPFEVSRNPTAPHHLATPDGLFRRALCASAVECHPLLRARPLVIESHDVHLIFNDRDKDAVARIDQELRNRGLIPWFWDRDGGANWYQEEVASIQENTPVSAIFLGPAGWGSELPHQTHDHRLSGCSPDDSCSLPGWRRDDLNQFPELTKRRWVEFKSLDDQSTLKALAQRVVDDAYELAGEAGSQQTGTAVAAGRRLMVYIPARSQTVESWISLRDRLSKEPELAGCCVRARVQRRSLEP